MLEVLSASGVVVFGVVSLVVGVRLLVLSAKTKALPEFALGTGLFVGVLFGFVPESIVYSTDLAPDQWVLTLIRVAEISIRICAGAVLVFTWRVFQPRSFYAVALVVLLAGLMVVSHVITPYGQGHAANAWENNWAIAAYHARTLALLWGTIESLRYWQMCKKRLSIGLVDPIATNRFLLWGVAMGAASFLMGSVILAPAFGLSASEQSWLLVESVFGGVSAGSIWLTFFPPQAYREWVTRAAES